ncbi:MAG: hypothetical protein OXR66_09020 [Candidatus Woesearchaeota archaeon]|nr:hypothetical protein [Candidatus Woesearchaeota archaeon]
MLTEITRPNGRTLLEMGEGPGGPTIDTIPAVLRLVRQNMDSLLSAYEAFQDDPEGYLMAVDGGDRVDENTMHVLFSRELGKQLERECAASYVTLQVAVQNRHSMLSNDNAAAIMQGFEVYHDITLRDAADADDGVLERIADFRERVNHAASALPAYVQKWEMYKSFEPARDIPS